MKDLTALGRRPFLVPLKKKKNEEAEKLKSRPKNEVRKAAPPIRESRVFQTEEELNKFFLKHEKKSIAEAFTFINGKEKNKEEHRFGKHSSLRREQNSCNLDGWRHPCKKEKGGGESISLDRAKS